ncbi:scaffold attachment factor B2-like [Biomphalaria glabrata]|uniref:Scaffold attachment factor B2-like n=1 Tax=Biomphalaria glabrata TaxID=6526 RepID=A0A9W2ZF76_BIOGL|nr:scaffold attachment factor B2-like [Biomphalaria glabrata]
MASTKTLGQLSLIELRRELRCRELKVSGNKEALMERLKQSIIDDEQDPDTYLFEIEPDTGEIWKSMKEQIKEDLKLVKDELKNELGNKLSSMESVVFGLKKDMDDYK